MRRWMALRAQNLGWPAAWWLAAVAAYVLEWMVWRLEVMGGSLAGAVVQGVFDAALLFVPYWWLRGRWRALMLVPVWVVPGLMLASAMYFRQFGMPMPVTSLRFTDNADSTLFRSALALGRATDWAFALLPLAVSVMLAAWWRPIVRGRVTRRVRLWATTACLALVVLGQAYYFVNVRSYLRSQGMPARAWAVLKAQYVDTLTPNMAIFSRGWVLYHAIDGAKMLAEPSGRRVPLSADDEAEVEALVTERLRRWPADTTLTANRGRNLVLIIVESLNSWAISPRHTPVLDSLIRAEGTVSALRLVTQTGHGGSSDGQIMMGTGLPALPNGSTGMTYPHHTFPSLAKELGYPRAFEVNHSDPRFWHHADIARAFAFDSLHSRADIESLRGPASENGGIDALVVDYALREIDRSPRPFFAQVLTLSMHVPFDDPGAPVDPSVAASEGYGNLYSRYLALTRYTDAQIGRLIDGLRRRGMADSTVVVIVSDHAVPINEPLPGGRPVPDASVAFIAANTGLTAQINRTAGQIDIYPTVLHLMGITAPAWPGLGSSLLDERLTSAYDFHGALHGEPSPLTPSQEAARRLGPMMIAADWWAGKPAAAPPALYQ